MSHVKLFSFDYNSKLIFPTHVNQKCFDARFISLSMSVYLSATETT